MEDAAHDALGLDSENLSIFGEIQRTNNNIDATNGMWCRSMGSLPNVWTFRRIFSQHDIEVSYHKDSRQAFKMSRITPKHAKNDRVNAKKIQDEWLTTQEGT